MQKVTVDQMPAAVHPTGDASRELLVLALDQGTTNSKAVLVDPAERSVLASGSAPTTIAFPAPGWVEQDADVIWSATMTAVERCLAAAGPALVARVGAVSISNQRESVVVWDAVTGEPRGPVIGWQDARTAPECRALAAAGAAPVVAAATGLSLDPMFSAPKMRWLLDAATAAGARPQGLRVGTVDTWLVSRLTGAFLAEAGNASRTLLLDLRTLTWSQELLEVFGIPASALAPVVASDAVFGTVVPGLPVPAGLPVAAVLADSHSALYCHSGGCPGEGKATYGTGSSVMLPSAVDLSADPTAPVQGPDGVATTLAWLTQTPTYAREGNVVASGAALTWMAQTLTDGDVIALGDLAGSVPDAGGTAFVPAFSGLGAPTFDRDARAVLVGMTGGTQRAHLARAAFEAVAHQVADVVEAMESDGAAHIDVLHADGGASASRLLMQLQADLLRRAVHVAPAPEASAMGAAFLAARAVGVEPTTDRGAESLDETTTTDRTVTPGETDWVAPARTAWCDALARARGHRTAETT